MKLLENSVVISVITLGIWLTWLILLAFTPTDLRRRARQLLNWHHHPK